MANFHNHIVLSGIALFLIFNQIFALPSGGKFTHGSSGNINIHNNTMNIHGHGINSVIQWGGGFNIGKNESVNFNGNSKNYLNIAHGANKSIIEGILNANGKNIFLINPNGVIITKTGIINANRFIASTSSISNQTMQDFASGKIDANTYSPIIKPNKNGGNIINMGMINAKDVVFLGNKLLLNSNIQNSNSINTINAQNIKLVGNEVDIDVSNINANLLQKLEVSAKDRGSIYLNASGYYYNVNSFNVFNKFISTDYQNIKHNQNTFSIYKFIGISSDLDWWHFAKGWNENKTNFRATANEYRLTQDIDFKGKNYANYCIDGFGCTNMIVGYKGIVYDDNYNILENNSFTNKTFNGQNFSLKNINIDTSKSQENITNVGIFGHIENSKFKNILIDYNNGFIKTNSINNLYSGGFAGISNKSDFENIEIKNISSISNQAKDVLYNGIFIGYIGDGNFNKIKIDNIKNISGISLNDRSHVGGFAGSIFDGKFSNINILNIDNIINNKTNKVSYTGGFVGEVWSGNFQNINLSNINNIQGEFVTGGFAGNALEATFSNINATITNITSSYNSSRHAYAGGFIGSIDSSNTTFKNINLSVNTIKSINSDSKNSFISNNDNGNAYAGGFTGFANGGMFDNINIKVKHIESINDNTIEDTRAVAGGFAGKIESGRNDKLSFKNISIENIDSIIAKRTQNKKGIADAGGFIGWIQSEGKSNFENISLYNIKNIQAKSYNHYVSAGGFIGYIEGNSIINKLNLNFKNIFLFFENNSIINATSIGNGKNSSGKFIGDDNSHTKLSFDNFFIYHYNKDFTNANSDSNYWNNINIILYNDLDKTAKYQEFLKKDHAITRPIIQIPENPTFSNKPKQNYPNIDNILKQEAILSKDDLNNLIIKNEILIKLLKQGYKLYLDTLMNMFLEKDYDKMTQDEKINFVEKYFIKDTKNSKSEALNIVQSLDFISAYGKNGLSNAKEDKFENGVKNFYIENIQTQIDNILSKKIFISNVIYGELKDIILNSKKLIEQLQYIKTQLQKAEKIYNEYIQNIDQVNSQELSQLLKNIKMLKNYQDIIISKLNLTSIKNKIEYKSNNGSFLIIGSFGQKPYDPNLENISLNPSASISFAIPSISKKNKDIIYIPTIFNNNFDYFFLFNSLGDELIKKEIHKNEIQTLKTQKIKKTCAVNDNFKAMNPCID